MFAINCVLWAGEERHSPNQQAFAAELVAQRESGMARARAGLRHTRKYQTCLVLGRKRIIMGKSQSTPQSAAGRCCRSRFPGAPLPFLRRCFRGKTETLVAAPQTSRAGMQGEQTVHRPASGAGGGRERPLRPPGSGRGSGPTARPGRGAREPVGAVRAVLGSGG